MSYQVLARKWRPQNFADLVGQEHVVKALVNALETGRLHHAYLFTGTRGVGKTTIARIFAKSLNCESGVSAEPCGSCSICQDIMAGRFFDLIEVDAASNTGVDDTRELLENAQYKPTSGRYKVYLIDEVHMFSKSSFNALLKTLEEPPEHVKFLLATTEQQKLPATVLSRCLQFNLKSMPQSLLAEHLSTILKAENIEFEADALAQVAKVADGSVRDSLSLVEQVAALGEGVVKSSVVENLLGVLSAGRVVELVRCIASGDAEKSMGLIAAMSDFSPDYRQLLADVLSVLHHVAMQQMVPGAATTSDWPAEAMSELVSSLSPEDVQLFYQIALQGQRDMPHAPLPRESFEMTVLRMLYFRQVDPASGSSNAGDSGVSLPENQTGNQSGSQSGQAPVATAEPDASTAESKQAKASAQVSETTMRVAQATGGSTEPATGAAALAGKLASAPATIPAQATPAPDAQALAVPALAKAASAQTEAPVQQPSDTPVREETTGSNAVDSVSEAAASGSDTRRASAESTSQVVVPQSGNWNAIVDGLAINGAAMQLARNSSLCEVEQQNGRQSITLMVAEQHEELKVVLACQRLEQSLSSVCNQPVQLVFKTGQHQSETVAQRDERLRQEAQKAAEASIAADPVVKNILERVDGELEQASIQPVLPA